MNVKVSPGPNFISGWLKQAGVFLVLIGVAQPNPGQTAAPTEADQIRQELRDLQQDYEKRMRALEDRLRRLESASPGAEATNVVVQPAPATAGGTTNAAARARQYAQQEFQHDTESRDHALLYERSPFAERVEQVLEDFLDIHGYIRAGYGRNNEGGSQVGFQAPHAFAKYRLGNEAENYGELTFGKSFYVPGLFKVNGAESATPERSGPLARVQLTMSMYNPYEELLNSSSTDFGLPEAWGSIGNVIPSQPSLKFWAGSRYYRRHDIHINDFFFYNMSGTGGGLEDLQLPFGRLGLAWIGAASSSGFSDLPEPDVNDKANFSKGNWDLRLYDVPLPLGKGELGLVYAHSEAADDPAGNAGPRSDGAAFTFLHTRENFISSDGVNKFSLQFGTGAAKTFTSGFETMRLADGIYIRPDDRDSWRFRATEHFTANITDSFSIGPAVLYQLTEYQDDGGRVHWASAGVRPILHFNRYLSLAGEFGIDWVKEELTGNNGPVYKLTLAPQVSLGRRFMSRPVIRTFVTYAHWDDDWIGQVGGTDYLNKSEGLTYGVQMEAWW